jgi:hypothetical protein
MGLTSGTGASNAIANTQAQNQNQANALTSQINAAFSSPAMVAQNQSYVSALQQYYQTQLQQQQQVASTNLNFAEDRSGLSGGSAASYGNSQLQKSYAQGLIGASQQAQGAGAQLAAGENAQKNSLVSLANAGNLTGSVSQAASQAQQQAIAQGPQGVPASLGNAFSNIAGIYQNEQLQAAQREAQKSPIGSNYGQSPFNG